MINSQLRQTHGVGLRSSVVDSLTARTREARRMGVPQIPARVNKGNWTRTLRRAGFLWGEILGFSEPDARKKRRALGAIMPDRDHPRFRLVMQLMITERYAELEKFQREADRHGWSRASAAQRWRNRILKHYREGKFGDVVGRFMTQSDRPSPWALYQAYLGRFVEKDPFGGLGAGDYAAPRGKARIAPVRPQRRSAIRQSISDKQENVRQLQESIQRRRTEGNSAMVHQHIQQVERIRDTIRKLEDELKKGAN